MPMDPDLQRHFDAVFDAHDHALRELREANTALASAIDAHNSTSTQLAHVVRAHDGAIAAALDANRAAIDLLHRLGNGSTPS